MRVHKVEAIQDNSVQDNSVHEVICDDDFEIKVWSLIEEYSKKGRKIQIASVSGGDIELLITIRISKQFKVVGGFPPTFQEVKS